MSTGGRSNAGGAVLGTAAVFLGMALISASPEVASAAVQDEIQVYNDDIDKPGETGLELHVNGTPSGVGPSFPGEIITNHAVRITPEWSYGLTKDVELGAYLPLTQWGEQDGFDVLGAKIRVKYLPWQLGEGKDGWYGGVNLELSHVNRHFAQSQWMSEVKPIIGYKVDGWHLSVNPNLEYELSNGFASWVPDLSPAVKLVKEVSKGVALGGEYYSDLGKIDNLLPWNKQDNRVYAVMDYDMSPYVFQLGVGRGITDAADKWTVKAILEIPLQAKSK